MRGFSDCLFKELRDEGIKVSQLMPGWVRTDMIEDCDNDGLILENMLKPSDLAYAVNFVLNCPPTCCPLEVLLYPQKTVQSKL